MIGTRTRNAVFVAVGCLLLAGCGPAKTSNVVAGAAPATPTASAAAAVPAKPAAPAAGGGLTACGLITEQDATAAIGGPAGKGTGGGTAALSECIYDDGSLIVSMKTDSKAFYDKSHAAALAKGVADVPGAGDSAFAACVPDHCTLLLLKGTTLVSVIFDGTGARNKAIAIAKVAAAKL